MARPREIPETEELREWLARCNPLQPLEPDHPCYYDLGKAIGDEHPVRLRGDYSVEQLIEPIELIPESTCQLFSGFSGTGKSTELRSLRHLLDRRGYSVLFIEAQNYHSLHRELAIEDLMVILAGAFGDALGERLGEDVIKEGFWQRLVSFLRQDLHLSDAKIPLGVADLKIGIGHGKPFWEEIRQTLALSLGKLRDKVHDFIRRSVAQLKEAEPNTKGVVFIVDNLERLRAPAGQFQQVMESVNRVLSDYSSFLRLPDCHVIYTVPPYVQLVSPSLNEHYNGQSFVLPAIKVTEAGLPLRAYEPGIQALRELVAKRLPLGRLFADEETLETLIINSGGHVRTLISFLEKLLLKARTSGLPFAESDVARVIAPFRERSRLRMGVRGSKILARILERGTLDGIEAEQHATLAGLMDEYLVLCYLNGENRYEVHPLIREHVEKLARERREKKR